MGESPKSSMSEKGKVGKRKRKEKTGLVSKPTDQFCSNCIQTAIPGSSIDTAHLLNNRTHA